MSELTTANPADTPNHNHKLFIETVGCQMNELDSELVVAALRHQGYELTPDVKQADTVLFNTRREASRHSSVQHL